MPDMSQYRTSTSASIAPARYQCKIILVPVPVQSQYSSLSRTQIPDNPRFGTCTAPKQPRNRPPPSARHGCPAKVAKPMMRNSLWPADRCARSVPHSSLARLRRSSSHKCLKRRLRPDSTSCCLCVCCPTCGQQWQPGRTAKEATTDALNKETSIALGRAGLWTDLSENNS